MTSLSQRVNGVECHPAAGNRIQRTDHDGETVEWGYDPSNQLTTEAISSGGVTTYVYDPAGNRRVKDDGLVRTTSTYDVANRLQTADDGMGLTTYTYDPAGNQRSIEIPAGDITTYSWTYENQLRSVEDPAGDIVTFAYTGDLMRLERESDSETTGYVWDGQNVQQEYDDGGLTTADYTLLPQPDPQPYGDLVSQNRDADSSFYHFDAQGSAQALTDGTETTTDEYHYDAFGKRVTSTGSTENPYQWIGETGYSVDSETGLLGLRRREYDAGEGRFVSEDPSGLLPGESNLYRYVWNSPTNTSDPGGEQGGRAPYLKPPAPPPQSRRTTFSIAEIEKLVNTGQAFLYHGTDKNFVVVIDGMGNDIRALLPVVYMDVFASGPKIW